jgi:hypothetical protein
MQKKSPQNPHSNIKKPKFICDICDYCTVNRKDFKKHEQTQKHIKNVSNEGEIKQESPLQCTYVCDKCECVFNCRTTLWRHNKKCEIEPISTEIVIADKPIEEKFDKDSIIQLIKQNKELQTVLMEQNAVILSQHETMKKMSTHSTLIQNNTTNHNTTNNQFNLNVFLNEQCKSAVNLIDFVNSLQVQIKDLEKTGQLGYVEGISSIFLKGLREMDIYKRPIHCTDLKRETVYVKDQDSWEKETAEKSKLRMAIQTVARKNLKTLPAWQEENPDFRKLDTKENNTFIKIALHSLGGQTDEEEEKFTEKIIKNVLKDVVIDRK